MDSVAPLQPRARAFLDALSRTPGPPLEKLPPEEARNAVIALQDVPIPAPVADVRACTIAGTPAWIYRPSGSAGFLPAVLYFHGGGWVVCNHQTHDRLMRELAAASGAALVFVEYPLSPEARYPAALEAVESVARHLAVYGHEYRLDGTRLCLAGDSAGANLATVVAIRAVRHGHPRFLLQMLFFPVTDAGMDTPSYREFADGHFLTRAQMKWFWDAYAPVLASRRDPDASPLRAPLDALRGMAPALVITADHDVLRDEGEAYARRLAAAGVRVTLSRYPGTIHASVVLNAVCQDPSPRGAIREAAAAVRAALLPERTGLDRHG